MAISKVVRSDGVTLVDLTSDTVSESTLANGVIAHGRDGNLVTGELVFSTYYVSQSTPSSSQGNNGDIWLVTA